MTPVLCTDSHVWPDSRARVVPLVPALLLPNCCFLDDSIPSCVLTCGSPVDMQVWDCLQDGRHVAFDGMQLGILHTQQLGSRLLFTHELLREFWDLTCETRITHKGWIRTKIKTWKQNIAGGKDENESYKKVWDLLCRPALVDRIYEALYDYVTLLDIDYKSLFSCQCVSPVHSNAHIVAIYDNACKW